MHWATTYLKISFLGQKLWPPAIKRFIFETPFDEKMPNLAAWSDFHLLHLHNENETSSMIWFLEFHCPGITNYVSGIEYMTIVNEPMDKNGWKDTGEYSSGATIYRNQRIVFTEMLAHACYRLRRSLLGYGSFLQKSTSSGKSLNATKKFEWKKFHAERIT